jgi:type VI secretion system Hcp family effector
MSSSRVPSLRKGFCVIGIAMVCFGGPTIAAAGDLITLQMPNIPGDLAMSALGLPKGSIEILSLAGGVSNSVSISGIAGGGAGKASFSSLNLSKRFDGASPALYLATAMGTPFAGAIVTFYHVNQSGVATAYFTITLTKLFVEVDTYGGSEKSSTRGGALDTENFSLAYGQIQLTDVATGASSCFSMLTQTTC